MAGSKNGKDRSSASDKKDERAPFVGYVNLTLTAEDKVDYEVWSSDSDLVNEDWLSALHLGYQFSIKDDPGNDAFLCSVSCWRPGKSDAGLIYTARSHSPYPALVKAVYVVSRKLAYDLSNGYVKRAALDAF